MIQAEEQASERHWWGVEMGEARSGGVRLGPVHGGHIKELGSL